ncbi:hypothetical protein BC629DRAFT_160810 [Irpex lacteus]|nr:hypothetical protein BC629DRAFT_160810 [Irpex lacteus]
MDKCPPEIHARIVSYACTDAGYTGCALSLVSHYFSQVSSPYRWQCIALPGYDQIICFANILARSKTRRPIHHLFLSDRRSELVLSSTDDYETKFLSIFASVLQYAAPTLRSLSFFSDASFYYGAQSVSQCLSTPYPFLQELTIRACCTSSRLVGNQSGDTLPCNMPDLTHLHLALPYHGLSRDGLQATHNLVRSISSAISHLRFTMLDKWGSRRVIEVIHSELSESGIVPAVLDLPPSDWDSPRTATASPVNWDRLLPDNLKLFAIQPSPTSTFYCSCCMDLRGDVDVMRILERMSDLADKERFVYMERRPIRVRKCRTDPMEVAGYGLIEARGDWLERIHGGGGCWRQKDDEDIDSMNAAVARAPSPDVLALRPNRKPGRRMTKLKNAFRKWKIW